MKTSAMLTLLVGKQVTNRRVGGAIQYAANESIEKKVA